MEVGDLLMSKKGYFLTPREAFGCHPVWGFKNQANLQDSIAGDIKH
jgi:hypothetical protein